MNKVGPEFINHSNKEVLFSALTQKVNEYNEAFDRGDTVTVAKIAMELEDFMVEMRLVDPDIQLSELEEKLKLSAKILNWLWHKGKNKSVLKNEQNEILH